MENANKKGPEVAAPEPRNETANGRHPESVPTPSTLFSLEGCSPPVDPIPEPDQTEAAEIERRAVILRDFLRLNTAGGTHEAALAWSGAPIRPPVGRPWVVNTVAPRLAIRRRWAVRTGGCCHASLSAEAHGGIIRHYRSGEGQP